MSEETQTPEQSENGKPISDKNLFFGVIVAGVILAIIWAGSLVWVANITSPHTDHINSIYQQCKTDTTNSFEKLQCAVADQSQNLTILDNKVENLGSSIEFSGIILGTIAAFFGALITVIVIFFAFKNKSEALAAVAVSTQEAELKLNKLFSEQAANNETYKNRVTQKLEGTNGLLKEAEGLLQNFQNALNEHKGEIESRMAELAQTLNIDEQPEPTEKQEDLTKIALAKPEHERSGDDWRVIAFYYVQKGNPLNAANAFAQSATRYRNDSNKARSFYNETIAYGEAGLPEIVVQKSLDLIQWGRDSDIPDIQSQVANTWLNMGVTYTKTFPNWPTSQDTEIQTYKDLINWGEQSDNPDVQEKLAKAYSNWVMILLTQYTQGGKTNKKLLTDAKEKIKLGYAINPALSAYNMACVAAHEGDVANVVEYLKESLKAGNLESEEHINIDPDLDDVRDTPEFQAFMKKAFPDDAEK